MTEKELDDFITHGETGFMPMALMFGEGWAQKAIDIAKELRAQMEQEEKAWRSLTSAETKALWTAAEKKPSQFAAMLEAKLKEKNGG